MEMNMTPFAWREAVASVALSHEVGCTCQICLAAQGDEVAMNRVIAHLAAESDARTAYTTSAGQRLVGVHVITAECVERGCPIHAPSAHPMRDWPTHWRDGEPSLMERTCEHGLHHPDPDSLSGLRRVSGDETARRAALHDCDGCCRKPQ